MTVVYILIILGLNTLSLEYARISYGGINNNLTEFEPSKRISNFSFVTAGDFGCTQEAKRTVSNMHSRMPTFVLALGDLSYETDANCWFELVSPLDTPGKIRITIGDHDIDTDLSRYNEYLNHFNLTRPYYSFNYQNVHFLAMATAKEGVIPYGITSEQYKFVSVDLKNAQYNNSIDWIVVYGFRPLYSSPTMHPGEDELRETYHPLFDEYGVDIVLQAHNHNYQRTYPLEYNEGNDSNPIVSDKHTTEYKGDQKGPIFITIGTAGQDFHDFAGQETYVVEQFQRPGFLDVDIRNNGSNLTATFYENRNGEDKDHFSIIKTR